MIVKESQSCILKSCCCKMHSKTVLILVYILIFSLCDANGQHLEGRGKKKKVALFVYFADLVVKKIFVLKLFYAFVLWCVIHKAGYFLSWFVFYLKDKHEDHHHHPHFEHGPPQSYGSSYGSYGPYKKNYKSRR